MFQIEDEAHAEPQGRFGSYEAAMSELRRRAMVPWDKPPNRCPCLSWRTCGRKYEIVEYDDACQPWRELRRVPVLDISANGLLWQIAEQDRL